MAWEISNVVHALGRFAANGTRLLNSPGLGDAVGHVAGSGVYAIPVNPPIAPDQRCVLLTCERDNAQQFYVGQLVETLSSESVVVVETFFSTASPLTPADCVFNLLVLRTG